MVGSDALRSSPPGATRASGQPVLAYPGRLPSKATLPTASAPGQAAGKSTALVWAALASLPDAATTTEERAAAPTAAHSVGL